MGYVKETQKSTKRAPNGQCNLANRINYTEL